MKAVSYTLRYFHMREFACRCGCGQNLIDFAFVEELDRLRAAVGFPIKVTSGYRCPDYNARVSTTGREGPHTTGRAADLAVDRANAVRLLRVAINMGFTGIGVQQKGAGRFIHLDNLPNTVGSPRPTIWSY